MGGARPVEIEEEGRVCGWCRERSKGDGFEVPALRVPDGVVGWGEELREKWWAAARR